MLELRAEDRRMRCHAHPCERSLRLSKRGFEFLLFLCLVGFPYSPPGTGLGRSGMVVHACPREHGLPCSANKPMAMS